jgi:hypothetical protein
VQVSGRVQFGGIAHCPLCAPSVQSTPPFRAGLHSCALDRNPERKTRK